MKLGGKERLPPSACEVSLETASTCLGSSPGSCSTALLAVALCSPADALEETPEALPRKHLTMPAGSSSTVGSAKGGTAGVTSVSMGAACGALSAAGVAAALGFGGGFGGFASFPDGRSEDDGANLLVEAAGFSGFSCTSLLSAACLLAMRDLMSVSQDDSLGAPLGDSSLDIFDAGVDGALGTASCSCGASTSGVSCGGGS